MIAYVAGPMSGYPLYNFPAFDECQDHLQRLGYEVISPADLDREVGFDPATSVADKYFLEAAMKRDVEAIMRVDFMVILPGWRSSVGATAEYHLAKWRHISVYEWPEMRLVDCAANEPAKAQYQSPGDAPVYHAVIPPGDTEAEIEAAFRAKLDQGIEDLDKASREYFKADPKAEEMARLDRLVVDNHRKCCPLPDLAAPDPKAEAASEKCPMHLLPPAALAQTAWVHGLGADKYGDWNWRETGIKFDTYVGAIMRHLMLAHGGEWIDTESGLPHIAHIAASCNILLDADHCGKLEKYE